MRKLNFYELHLAEGGKPPSEFCLLPAGEVEFVDGRRPILVDDRAMADTVSAFDARGTDLVVDYHHQTEGLLLDDDGHPVADKRAPDGRAPAAGWIKKLVARVDGLWAAVEWTEQAAKYLAAREYRYFSPVYLFDKKSGRLAEVVSVALTNNPATRGIAPLVAEAAGATPDPNEGKEKTMDLLKELIAALGLAETATAEDVLAKVKDLLAASTSTPETEKEAAEVRRALGLAENAPLSSVKGNILALKARPGDDLVREFAELKQKLAGREADELVERGVKAGQIAPAMRDFYKGVAEKDPDAFKVFLEKAPKVAPIGDGQAKDSAEPGRTADGLTGAERDMARSMGLTPEQWKKGESK